MDVTRTVSQRLPNGALLRVLGGVLLGIGIGPLVLIVLTAPIRVVFGEIIAGLAGPTIHFFAVVFGLVTLHLVRLFHAGDWKSLE
ncbi:hypothetical protein [Haloplanus halobius]|uniref:hypothetical protein n=1 Tax=Haloplanus halobius TaxID=2934938 RepID=UPI00200BE453|nr:hypothetical protein [Haloplanus sp. XH21]